MTGLTADLRAAIKALVAARGFTAMAVTNLSAGLALAVVILTVVNAYVFRSLPFPAADRLYRVDLTPVDQVPPPALAQLDWSILEDVIEVGIAWDLDVFYLLGDEYPECAPGGWVTPGMSTDWASGQRSAARSTPPTSSAARRTSRSSAIVYGTRGSPPTRTF